MYAVIKTGGKQHRVTEGEMLSIEKIEADEGRLVDFDQVLLIENGDDIRVGEPVLSGAVVRAVVVENYKGKKVIVFKKKKRKGYKKTRGHRQHLTKIQVEKIILDVSLLSEEERVASVPAVEVVEKKAVTATATATSAKIRKSPVPPAKKAKAAPKKAVEKPAAKKAAKPRAVKTAAKTTAKPAKKKQE